MSRGMIVLGASLLIVGCSTSVDDLAEPDSSTSTATTQGPASTTATTSSAVPPSTTVASTSTTVAGTTTIAPLECVLPPGDSVREHAGSERTLLFAPAEVIEPAPVLLLIHGFAGVYDEFAANTGLLEEAPANGVHLVVPKGAGTPPTWESLGGPFDDAGFVAGVIDELALDPCVDPDQIWMAGYSAGAGFIATFTCRSGNQLAGMIMNAATAPLLCNDVAGFDAIITHGTADLVVPYTGLDIGTGVLPPAPDLAAQWASQLGCENADTDGDPNIVGDASADGTGVGVATRQRWSGCGTEANTVDMVSYDGGGHRWPGRTAVGGEGLVPPTPDLTCIILEAIANTDDPISACL